MAPPPNHWLWYVQAGKYDVLPIDGSAVERLMTERPQVAEPRDNYTCRPGTQTVPTSSAPRCSTARTTSPPTRRSPVVAPRACCSARAQRSAGGRSTCSNDRLRYVHNYVRRAIYRVSSPDPVPAGRHQLRFEFEPTGPPDIPSGRGAPGRAQLYIDGTLVAETEMAVTTPVAINPGGLTCGATPGSPVSPDYTAPFRFTAKLHTVTVDLSGELIRDSEADLRVAMARQ